eukprot:IDg11596t1
MIAFLALLGVFAHLGFFELLGALALFVGVLALLVGVLALLVSVLAFPVCVRLPFRCPSSLSVPVILVSARHTCRFPSSLSVPAVIVGAEVLSGDIKGPTAHQPETLSISTACRVVSTDLPNLELSDPGAQADIVNDFRTPLPEDELLDLAILEHHRQRLPHLANESLQDG